MMAHRLLKRCLEKDPKRRLRDIGDAWQLLEDSAPPAARNHVPWVVAGLLTLTSAIALWAPWRSAVRPVDQPSTRLDFDLGPGVSFGSTTGPAVILSPDGTRLVFVSQGEDEIRRLFTRRLDEPRALQLTGTEGAYSPFFSPDGQWVGFFAQGKLKKTRVEGGEPISLCDAPASRGGAWGEDGNIVAALDQQAGLSQIPPQGGEAVAVTKLNPGETTHRWPQVLPGAKAVLFLTSIAYGHYDDAGIAVVSLKDRRTKTLLEHGGMYPRYLPSGHLIYVTKGNLFAVAFDLDRLEVRGAPTLLWEVAGNPNLGFAQLDFSRNGTLAYRTGGAEGLRALQWLDGSGKTVSLGLEPAYYLMPRLSPDGRRVVYAVSQGSNQNLWMYDFERGIRSRLTNGQHAYPVWTPDGQILVFHAGAQRASGVGDPGLGGMFWTRTDGAGKQQPLTRSAAVQLPFSFSPGGTRLAYSELTPGAGAEIRTVPVENSAGNLRVRDPQVFLKTAVGLTYPMFSPDGRWLAYANAEGGQYEVYVRAFPDNGTQVQISNAGGVMPMWSRNGGELFYRTEDQRIMVANYTVKGNSLVPGKPRVWFGKQLANVGLGINLDLAPDGRFLVVMAAESPDPRESQSHVILVTNFFDEVRRRIAGQTK
jgi:serine/threonine-protein kinase